MLIVIIGFIIIAFADLPGIIRKKDKKALAVYCIIFTSVLTLSILQAAGVKIPSPMVAIGQFMKNVLHLSYQ